jgi:hypothetical protein
MVSCLLYFFFGLDAQVCPNPNRVNGACTIFNSACPDHVLLLQPGDDVIYDWHNIK